MTHTRRDVLRLGGLALAASTIGAAPLDASAGDSQDARGTTADLFAGAIVFDALSNEEDGEWSDAIWDAVKRSGVTGIHTSLANATLDASLRDLAGWQARFDRYPGRLRKVLVGADLTDAKKTGRLGVLLGFQNATMLGNRVDNVDVLHALGARCIQLTYNARNLLGDGCTERTNAGLSDFGVAVVSRMNERRMIVDLSHCGEQTSRDGIALSRQPPAFTHTMCKAVHDHVRAKSDDLLRAMAEKGGMIGVATLGYFVGPTAATTFDDYLRHVDHAVKVAGIDHVGVASDYSLRGIEATETRESWYVPRLTSFKPIYNVRWPPWVKELDPPERFKTIADGLAKRGYPSASIEKILGGNWLRYLTTVLG